MAHVSFEDCCGRCEYFVTRRRDANLGACLYDDLRVHGEVLYMQRKASDLCAWFSDACEVAKPPLAPASTELGE
jgi:hypothetical protein